MGTAAQENLILETSSGGFGLPTRFQTKALRPSPLMTGSRQGQRMVGPVARASDGRGTAINRNTRASRKAPPSDTLSQLVSVWGMGWGDETWAGHGRENLRVHPAHAPVIHPGMSVNHHQTCHLPANCSAPRQRKTVPCAELAGYSFLGFEGTHHTLVYKQYFNICINRPQYYQKTARTEHGKHFQTCAHSLLATGQWLPPLPWARVKCSGMLEGKEYTSGALGRWGLSTADLWLLTPEADLLLYYKNNASVWVAGVTAMLGRVAGAPQYPTARPGRCAGWRRATALSLHVPDKGLH